MTQLATRLGRTARRLAILAVPLIVATTGPATAHGGGSYDGGTMGLWGLLWMGILLAVPLYLVFAIAKRGGDGTDERPLSVLRERYARGELSDEEFERRRQRLERTG